MIKEFLTYLTDYFKMNYLIKTDKAIFEIINGKWHTEWLDFLMPFVRNSQTWVPLYLFLILFVLFNFKKNIGWWLLFFALVPIAGDLISSGLIKKNFYRLRPCNDPDMIGHVRFLLGYHPQSSSFTSSHATNHFAMASFFFYTLKPTIKNYAYLFYLWAVLICYAQIYVGVHYPLDIICGAILGFSIGYFISLRFNKQFGLS